MVKRAIDGSVGDSWCAPKSPEIPPRKKGFRMPLVDLNVPIIATKVPRDVRVFLREANRRIERFQVSRCVPGFVPSDFERAYRLLYLLASTDLTAGCLFCEWGSGFGVITCLAALLGFEACGIEIDVELVEAAQQLAVDFGLSVDFVRASFIPKADEAYVNAGGAFSWLTTDGRDADRELGLAADEPNVIYAYPWPDEERVTGDLFERNTAVGTILVTYHGGDEFRLRRRTDKKSFGRKTARS